MAIYKPSNCVPFLDTWDLTQEQSVSFEINTNNNIVNGYKIKILDNKNNVIFESKEFSPINSNGIAYNGDVIEERLIIRIQSQDEVKDSNVIYYNIGDGEYYYNGTNGVTQLKNFSNGYIDQPYKWQVVLAQGLIDKNGVFIQTPTDDKYYDMIISNGKVIGSTSNRIQGALSEYIYKDYFIQLIGKDKKTTIGNRALITSYDHTYGHITPKEGWFTQDDIDKAFYFQIFKNTNQTEYINTNRIVNNITGDDIMMGNVGYKDIEGNIVTSKWEPSANTSKYYFIQTYPNMSNPEGDKSTKTKVNVNIPLGNYCGANVYGNFTPGETMLLVRGEGTIKDGKSDRLSPYNGVFLFVSAEWNANQDAEGKYDTTKGALTITWQRPAMADTWAEFLGQSFFVLQTGENWDSNATSSGTINSTKLAFYLEKAIEIYPNNEDKTLGEVYKTNESVPDKLDTYRIYVRPFIGIEDGMRFKWVKYNEDGSYKEEGFIDYGKLDTRRWCIEYKYEAGSGKNKPNFTPDTDTYTFVSYFKISDENPFYAYSEPEIKIIKINEENDVANKTDLVINNRTINVVGEYSPADDNKMWKSFQWSLYDFNYNTIQYNDVKYAGEIAAQFIGLEKDHNYELTLTIEDELGRTFSTFKDFVVSDVTIVDPFVDALEDSFNCALHSIDVSVAGTYGVIDEGLTEESTTCSEETICSDSLLCGGSSNGIYYKNISIGSGISKVEGTLIEPTTGDLTLNFETTIKDTNFVGDIIGIEFGDVEDNPYLSRETNNDLITAFLPEVTTYNANTGLSRVNENRYKIYTLAKIAAAQNKQRVYTVKLYDTHGKELDGDNWQNNRKACFGYQPQNPIIQSDCDYIIADEWLDESGNYLRTLLPKNGWEYNFTSNYEGMPILLDDAISGDTTMGIWSDKKLKAFEQPNGQIMQLITDEDNIWSDKDANGKDNIWSDTGYGAYEQIEIQDKTGRELFNETTLNFNLAFKNYVYKPAVSTNIYAQCVVKKQNT